MNDPCGCCEPAAGGPQPPSNRPGLSALAYRLGTHASFLEAMRARLSAADYPALGGLTTRDPSDPAIAVLDAWATVADVLCFYQERIANEGYLRTATERRSVRELGWLVGYRLRPGVAASTYLAYTVEDGPDVTIPAGSRAQSVPGPGEQMQSFETSDDLIARAEWNALLPRTTRPINVTPESAGTMDALYFRGITTNLSPNDRLLIVFEDAAIQPVARTVLTVEPDAAANRTKVALRVVLDPAAFIAAVLSAATGYAGQANAPPDRVPAGSLLQGLEAAAQTASRGLRQGPDAQGLYQHLVDALAALRALHDQAIAGADLPLQDWLTGVLGGLQQLADQLEPQWAVATPPRSAPPPKPAGGAGSVVELVGPLTLPPAVRPPSVLALPRDQGKELNPGSDGFTQMLTELRPDLDPRALYTAWSKAVVTPPPSFKVYALRKRAAVFGNNAPQQPIVVNGQITGYQEWTLFKPAGAAAAVFGMYFSAVWGAVILPVGSGPGPGAVAPPPSVTANVTVQLDGVWVNGSVTTAAPRLTVGDVQLTLTPPEASQSLYTLTVTFTRGDLGTPAPFVRAVVDTNNFRAIPSDPAVVTITGATTTAASMFQVVGQLRKKATEPTEHTNIISLDASYPQVLAGGWIVLEKPNAVGPRPPTPPTKIGPVVVARVNAVSEGTRADYGITAKGTQVKLDRDWLFLANPGDKTSVSDDFATIRNTTVYAQSEALELAEAPTDPVANPVAGGQIELDRLVAGLTSGRWLVVSGERIIPGTSGITAAELVMLQVLSQGGAAAPGDATHSTLVLANPLAYSYKADTVTISANVVEATHGETRKEVLGGGDGGQPFQHFTLKQAHATSPLTYVAAPTTIGVRSTLQVSVNDVVWREQESLLEDGPTDHVYTTSADDGEKVTVTFGDGVRGARLPTGSENVKAIYRVGIGRAGNVSAEQISLLATRPLGVKAVVNPLEASGGADPDDRDSARRNVPLGATALGRLVSVQDYADLARTFAGIGKASAARRAVGRRRLVHLTVAGAEGVPIDQTSELYKNLVAALHDFGDPSEAVEVKVARRLLILIAAHVFLAPDYLWEGVEPKVRAALEDAFAFDRRDLGQPVFLSEVIALIQGVQGVLYVRVDTLWAIDQDVFQKGQSQIPSGVDPDERIDVRPDQIAYLTPAVPSTLILNVGTT
jgi:predicted phage baseplate assembly protein